MQPEDVSRVLYVPDLQELAKVIQDGILPNYETVSVSVVQCPELTEIGCSGFGGNSCICDVGGVNNMEYVVNTNKFHFDMKNIAEKVGIKNGVIIGAAASKPDCSLTHDNSELMPCLNLSQGKNLTKEAYVDKLNGQGKLADYPHSELSSLGNLLICEDVSGENVIKIEASKRIGKLNFVNAVRLAILNHYGNDKQIGMGGYFVIHDGSIKSHIMPSFPPKDSPGDPSWLHYFEVPSTLVCLSVFVSNDVHGDELRLEHTHFWARDGSTGGHYHTDVTPETVKYEAYYKPASTLWRIGKALVPK